MDTIKAAQRVMAHKALADLEAIAEYFPTDSDEMEEWLSELQDFIDYVWIGSPLAMEEKRLSYKPVKPRREAGSSLSHSETTRSFLHSETTQLPQSEPEPVIAQPALTEQIRREEMLCGPVATPEHAPPKQRHYLRDIKEAALAPVENTAGRKQHADDTSERMKKIWADKRAEAK